MQEIQIVNKIITDSNCIVFVMIHLFKFYLLYFRESLTPYYLLFPQFHFSSIIIQQMYYYLSPVFLSGNIHSNPGPVQFHKFNDTSLDVYEPFCSSLPQPKLRIALLNARSVCNKSAIIYNHILENRVLIFCV